MPGSGGQMYLIVLPLTVLFSVGVGAVTGVLVNATWSVGQQVGRMWLSRTFAVVVGGISFGAGFSFVWSSIMIGFPGWFPIPAALAGAAAAALLPGNQRDTA
jgi:hypothetical protein